MTNDQQTSLASGAAIPPDNPHRRLMVVSPDDPNVNHISIVGNTYRPRVGIHL